MPADEPVQLSIDGQTVDAAPGARLLDVLRGMGVRVPTLCHDPRLAPYGGCRLCIVTRRDGRGGLVPACSTSVLPGMVIETRTPEAIESRRQQLQLLASNHRLECPACERRGDCRFQDLLYEYGVADRRLPFDRIPARRDDLSPVISRDPEKCILCGKCVRLCDEVQGVAAIGLVYRGLNTRVATQRDRPLDCEFCGQCVNACPVGALVARPYSSEVPAWLHQQAATTCSFCSCGCQLSVRTHAGTIVRVDAGVDDEPNHGKLCAKGWLGLDALSSDERLRHPLVRKDGRLVEATWEEALGAIATALDAARADALPVAAIGGSRLTCEDAYLLQRFVRTATASGYVGLGPAGGAAALTSGMAALTGVPRSSATFEALRAADVVLVLRGDPGRTHPLVKTELVQGVRQRGQKLILAHSLSGGLERHATTFLPLHPGGEEALLHAVTRRLIDAEDSADLRPIDGFEDWAASLRAYSSEIVQEVSGVAAGAIDGIAAQLRDATRVVTVVVTGLGIPGDEAAVTRAAVVLDALLGARGCGVLVLGEKANLQGVIDVGMHPEWLPGAKRADAAPSVRAVQEAWQHALAAPPLSMPELLQGRSPGVLYLVGQDPIGAWPRDAGGQAIVERARFVVVQDAFLTETGRRADVVLPVAILAERAGSVVGADGVRRTLHAVVTPPTQVPQDGVVFRELARRLGVPLPAADALEAELSALVGWPIPRPTLRRLLPLVAPAPAPRLTGMRLDASPQLFRSGSVTGHSKLLQALAPSVALRIAPRDAADLGVGNGDAVRLTVGGREALLRARLDPMVRPGTVVAHWSARWGPGASLMVRDGDANRAEIRRSP